MTAVPGSAPSSTPTGPDYAPIGTVGASAIAAAAVLPALPLPRLAGRPLPLALPARLYVCGITPYDVTHLGHAATFVWADALARVLRLADIPSLTTRNVTDVDDVLTAAAARQGADYASFGLVQEHQFDRDMKALSVREPQHVPRARHHIDHVIRLASTLLSRKAAYERDGTVYFRAGDIALDHGLDRDEGLRLLTERGDRPDDPNRDDPFDVPVWQRSGPEDPAWPSPWGPGRPGWHAECSAMALATLGGLVDVLVGGSDLAFPHHAYQSAIAAAVTDGPFRRATMSVGAVRYRGHKMAKSTGNLVLVNDLLSSAAPAALRLMLLHRPWSHSWEFEPSEVTAATETLDELYRAAGRAGGSDGPVAAVTRALLDDLDVPTALTIALSEGGDAARLVIRTLALD
ncbi:cysteine--tRNA ligase [Actinomycetospora sp. NBRC 106375]|uniref:cysteine--tRNA ligase n=1 Tax=Actinomycetospora sp. NBRC 106375 TaxID=3032207 RepID=UPI00249FE9D0|nr:cysteine--tRNA ligase [Actinomycetospora sp. NBRC 106375]GLZ49767.1 cysteine--tRNA ligase [Actinomycetospora sp. NBRC 106375]